MKEIEKIVLSSKIGIKPRKFICCPLWSGSLEKTMEGRKWLLSLIVNIIISSWLLSSWDWT